MPLPTASAAIRHPFGTKLVRGGPVAALLAVIVSGLVGGSAQASDADEPRGSSTAAASEQAPESFAGAGGLGPALLRRDEAVIRAAVLGLAEHRQPFLVGAPIRALDPVLTEMLDAALVLPARDQPYTLSELVTARPGLATVEAGALLLRRSIIVGPGAHLVVDSLTTPIVRLVSRGANYPVLAGYQGWLELRGHQGRPLQLTSWDPHRDSTDLQVADGRPYVRMLAGRLTLSHTRTSQLGFGTGASSGVSWMAYRHRPATGGASNSSFTGNYFGAYASGAKDLRLVDVDFTGNLRYGFDPHTHTDDMSVVRARATGNGSHGIILSKGCHDNVVRDSSATGNGGAGFMIDDGNPDLGERVGSDRNLLLNVYAAANAGPGIVIEGGQGNRVANAQVHANNWGIWLRDTSTSVVYGSHVTGNRLGGLLVSGRSAGNVVLDNELDGMREPVSMSASATNWLVANTVTWTPRPIAAAGGPARSDSMPPWQALLHRLALLEWALILVLPIVVLAASRLTGGPRQVARRAGASSFRARPEPNLRLVGLEPAWARVAAGRVGGSSPAS